MKMILKVITAVLLLLGSVLPLAAQSKSPSYSASGAFSTPVDSAFNPGSFQSVQFDTLFAYTGVNSRYLDIGLAFRFGKVYTALGYSGNVFDFTGFNLMAINMIKPRRVTLTPNTESGNLQQPMFSNKAILLIGAGGLNNDYFKNIGFKITVETLSAKHTKEELYRQQMLTVAPLNPTDPVRFGFKDPYGVPIKTDGTDKSAVRVMFDWSGFRFPIGSRTLTIKPFFGVDINRSLTAAVTDSTEAHTEGRWNNGTTDLKTFLNTSYGEFSLNYYFSYKFFPRTPQQYRYRSVVDAAGTKTTRVVQQTYDQTGRLDMTNKLTAGYKPTFNLADSTILLTPAIFLTCELRSVTMPHTLITTQYTMVEKGTVNRVVKKHIKEYAQKTVEQRFTVSPIIGLGMQYRIIKDKLSLNAGVNVQMDYVQTHKTVIVPSVKKVTGILTVDPSKIPPEKYEKVGPLNKTSPTRTVSRRLGAKGTFGIGVQWNINSVITFDTAFTVLTDFKNAAFTRENCNLAVALSAKL